MSNVNARRSIFFRRSDSSSAESKRYFKSYPYMFIEDMRNGIVPYERLDQNNTFKVAIVPENPTIEQRIVKSLSRGRYYKQDIKECLCDFFREIIQEILIHSGMAYEIVMDPRELEPMASEDSVTGEPQFFTFARIPSGSFYVKGQLLCQQIPDEIATQRRLPKQIEIPLRRVAYFELPSDDNARVFRALSQLAVLSDYQDLLRVAYSEEGRWNKRFDSEIYHRDLKLSIAEASKETGWNARGLFDDVVSEYYQVWRQLKYESLKIRIRNSFLGTLNLALANTGEEMGFSARVAISGLPSLRDVEMAHRNLENGGMSFEEVLTGFSI